MPFAKIKQTAFRLLVIGFISCAFYFLPSFINSASAATIKNIGLISDVPNLTSLLYYFTSQTPLIKGTAEPISTVYFKKGSVIYATEADSSGNFSIQLKNPSLTLNSNKLEYYSVDSEGNISSKKYLTLIVGCDYFTEDLKVRFCKTETLPEESNDIIEVTPVAEILEISEDSSPLAEFPITASVEELPLTTTFPPEPKQKEIKTSSLILFLIPVIILIAYMIFDFIRRKVIGGNNVNYIHIIAAILFYSALFLPQFNLVKAATYTWDGGGTDGTCGGAAGDGNKWSCAANWSTNIVPLSTDSVVFDGTSTKDATIDSSFQGTVSSITINAGYTGTITQARSFTTTTTFTQSAGTYTAANQAFNVTTDFTLNTGTFTASSGTSTFSRALTISGGTFNHNNGTVAIAGAGGGGTISCNNATFNLVTFSFFFSNRAVSSNCTLPVGNNPSVLPNNATLILNGILTGSGTLNTVVSNSVISLESGSSLSGFTALTATNVTYNGGSITGINSLTAAGAVTVNSSWNAGTYTTFDVNGAFTLNSPAVFTAPSGTSFFGSTFTLNSGSTFTHNNGLVNFDGGSATLSCNNATFNQVTFSHGFTTKVVSTNCTLPLGTNPTVTASGGDITLNGTFTGTGTLTWSSGIVTVPSPGVISGFTAFSGNALTYSGGNISSITGVTVTTFTSAATFDASNLSPFTATTLVISGGTFTSPANITVTTFTQNSGSTFIAPSGTLTVFQNFTVNAGATYTHNNGTFNISSNTGTTTTITCNGAVFNLVQITATGTSTKVISSGCNLPMGNNPGSLGNTILTLNGTISGTGTFTKTGGTGFILGSTGALSGFTALSSNNAVTYSGANLGSITSVTITGTTTVTSAWDMTSISTFSLAGLTLNSGANVTVPSGFSIGGVFTQNTGSTFNASSGTITFRGAFTINGGTFNHNSGTVAFGGTGNSTFSCNNITFNSVTFTHTAGTKTISSNCTLPIGVNPTVPSAITLNGALTGSGALTFNSTFTMNSGSSLNCFSSLSANPFIYNGGTLCGLSAPYTWDGEGSDGSCGGSVGDGNKWSCALNWSGDVVPGPLDTVTFNSTSTKNAFIDEGFQGSVLSMTIASGYTGTITQDRSLITQGFYTQSDGTFIGSNDPMTIGSSFVLNTGSTFTAPNDVLSVTSTFTINTGVTFNHNSGTVNFNTSAAATITCNSAVFNLVTFKYSGNGTIAALKTISANCTFPLGNNPIVEGAITLTGTLTGSGTFYIGYTLTLNDGSGFTGFSAIGSVVGPTANSFGAGLVVSTNKNFDASNLTSITLGNGYTTGASAIFTAPPIMTIGGGFTMANSHVFNHNNGTIIFTDPQVGTASSSLTCNTHQLLNRVVFLNTVTTKILRATTAGNTCDFPVGNNAIIPGPIMVGQNASSTGKLSGTGTVTINGDVTHNPDGIISDFDEVIFNGNYTYTTPIFTNVDKITFDQPQTFSTTFNGSQFSELVFNDDVSFTGGTFTSPISMKVAGDWTVGAGTFTHNNGTVEFIEATDKTISGSTTFNILKFAPSVDPTLFFEAGSTQTILGTLILKGQAGEMVNLRSTSDGDEWNIDPQGTYVIQYVNVSDSVSPTSTITVGCDSTDGGNNTNWLFAQNCTPSVSNLGPDEMTSGSETTDSQPTLTFDISDPNAGDRVQFVIEIDNNADFSSAEVCYTSGFLDPGTFSFTVGQEVGEGTYSCGSEGQSLENGNYYWRVKAIDQAGHTSEYSTANNGNIAFKKVNVAELVVTIIEDLITPGPSVNEPGEELPETGGNNGGTSNEITSFFSSAVVVIGTINLITTGVFVATTLGIGGALPFERIGVFVAMIFPRKKKYWGLVYDEVESKGIPFAVIRLLQNSEVKHTTVSDLEGRYGILVDEPGVYTLVVNAEGFKTYSSQIKITSSSQEVIKDINPQRINKQVNYFNRLRFYAKRDLIKAINILWLPFLLIGLVVSVYAAVVSPTPFNFVIIFLYIVFFLVNIFILIKSKMKHAGSVVEAQTKVGIPNAAVRFYDEQRQLMAWLTNKKGELKVNMKEGKYEILASKSGYKQLEENSNISITKEGYMDKNVGMKKTKNINTATDNPF